jgi:hypothetical protein
MRNADAGDLGRLLRLSREWHRDNAANECDKEYPPRSHWMISSARTKSDSRWSSTRYSMTWSARSSSVCGIVRPSVFAVLRLMTSSY